MSDLFVKMCRESKRLQEAWKPKEGDRVYDTVLEGICVCGSCKHAIWLPRQEDLQELYTKENEMTTRYGLLEDFFDFVNNIGKEYDYAKTGVLTLSMTCWWLLFVHKELWNQTWDFKEGRWEG